jgi:hypothetical protein
MSDSVANQSVLSAREAFALPSKQTIIQVWPRKAKRLVETVSFPAGLPPRMLFASPSPKDAVEDSQNEGCNI